MEVGVHCHAEFTPAAAIRLGRACEPYRPIFLEDPVIPENIDVFAKRRRGRAFIQALLILPIMWLLAAGSCVVNTTGDVPGVLSTKLPIGCDIWHFTLRSEQPFRTFVLACSGVDAIRLWPLPIQQPWAEDWFEHSWPPPTAEPQKS